MRAPPGNRRDRLRAMLADLKMPGALEAVDGILAQADSGAATAGEARMAVWRRRLLRSAIWASSNCSMVLGDEIMAAALIDRLLHHCHTVNIRGNSYRMREHQNLMRPAHEHEGAVPCQPALREGLDSGRYAPSVHPLTPHRYQPESVRSATTPPSEVGHFRLPLTTFVSYGHIFCRPTPTTNMCTLGPPQKGNLGPVHSGFSASPARLHQRLTSFLRKVRKYP